MSRARRFENATQLDTLNTYESVFEKSRQTPGKLIVALFDIEFPDQGIIEGKLKSWQHHYETTYGTKFYKYIITKGEQKIKTDFNIEDTPTLIFVRDGIIIYRIDDLDEANAVTPIPTKEGEENKDEKRVKQKLDELCQKA